MSDNHHIIVHAFTSDELGDHYLDGPAPPGTEVKWTAYERDFTNPDGDFDSPWEADAATFEDIEVAVRERCAAIGLDPAFDVHIEHYPEDVYL